MFSGRKRTIWFVLIASLVFLNRIAFSEEKENFKPRFSFKLSSGTVYMSLGDINENINTESYSGKGAERYWPVEFLFTDGIENIHYGLNFEGELKVNIFSNFAIGIGTEFIQAKKESYSIFRGESYTRTITVRESYEQELLIFPVKLGIYYQLSLFPRTSLLFNIGAGYYFAKASLYSYQHGATHWFSGDIYERYWTEHTYKVSGNNLGFHGGIGFEYNLTRNFSLVIEAQGRYAKIKELKGKDIMVTTSGGGDKEIIYGTLWYYHFISDGDYYTNIVLSDTKLEPLKPTDTAREAMLDLSGLSVRIGIRVRLF